MGSVSYSTRRDRNHPQVYRTRLLDFEGDEYVDFDALVTWVESRPDSYHLEIDEKSGWLVAEYVACGANAHDLKEGWPLQDDYRLRGTKTRICGCSGAEDECALSKETRRITVAQQIEKWKAASE